MAYFLKPGSYCLGDALSKPVYTVLGSCISVILYEERGHFAICHYLLIGHNEDDSSLVGKFGKLVLPMFVRKFSDIGIKTHSLNALVLGGASSTAAMELPSHLVVGKQNTEFALTFLQEVGIEVMQNDTGGHCGRRITYDPQSRSCSVVYLEPLGSSCNA